MVVGPKGIVDAWVPTSVSSDDVVGSVDGSGDGGEEKEEENREIHVERDVDRLLAGRDWLKKQRQLRKSLLYDCTWPNPHYYLWIQSK